jgi:hypothetical protein
MFSVIGVAGNNNLTQYHYAIDVLKEGNNGEGSFIISLQLEF